MTDDEKKKTQEHDHDHGDHTDVKEVREILDVVGEKIPKLLNDLTDVLYGKEQSQKYGTAVAGFYKSLKDAGITDAQAFELTQQYMGTLNIGNAIASAIGNHGGHDDDDDMGDDIKKAINIKIKSKLKEKGLDTDDEA
ncbi:MAG: hypothetical protein V1934_07290 [Methanobacteriota archaeon]